MVDKEQILIISNRQVIGQIKYDEIKSPPLREVPWF